MMDASGGVAEEPPAAAGSNKETAGVSARSAASAPVIALDGIRKRFGDLEVLRGVDLEAREHDVIAIIGSSGSGKSTLLRCANLLEIPEEGDIAFLGEQIAWTTRKGARLPADAAQLRRVRTNLAMVFQQFNLWAHMTVLENVCEAPVTVQGRERAEVEALGCELLDKVGILAKADSYPAELSGGQQQRAAIARALAMEPAAMLFDEPTSALDPELEQEVIRVIRSLAEEGRTMIMVTHDMNMARDLASHVVFIDQGLIEEQGPPGELFSSPRSARLKQFLEAGGG